MSSRRFCYLHHSNSAWHGLIFHLCLYLLFFFQYLISLKDENDIFLILAFLIIRKMGHCKYPYYLFGFFIYNVSIHILFSLLFTFTMCLLILTPYIALLFRYFWIHILFVCICVCVCMCACLCTQVHSKDVSRTRKLFFFIFNMSFVIRTFYIFM